MKHSILPYALVRCSPKRWQVMIQTGTSRRRHKLAVQNWIIVTAPLTRAQAEAEIETVNRNWILQSAVSRSFKVSALANTVKDAVLPPVGKIARDGSHEEPYTENDHDGY